MGRSAEAWMDKVEQMESDDLMYAQAHEYHLIAEAAEACANSKETMELFLKEYFKRVTQ